MPEFWEFPTVSMGLTALNSIYQARFNRYLHNRGIKDTSEQHVWAFLGDGEMGEPESLGAIGVAAREELDNLTLVINCNLQQLDGPVRGNGKIIQELESYFRGAGWNVDQGRLGPRVGRAARPRRRRRPGQPDEHARPTAQFQTYSVEDGAYIREHFFGADPRLRKMVEHMSDREIEKLPRGGHDYRKVYAAFDAATKHVGQPTVILAHTDQGLDDRRPRGQERHPPDEEAERPDDLKTFRDRLYLPITDQDIDEHYEFDGSAPFYHPGEDSPEIEYMLRPAPRARWRRPDAPGEPARRSSCPATRCTPSSSRARGKQKIATTMALVRLLRDWMKDPEIGQRIVPIAPDEYRTFGMDSMFLGQGLQPGGPALRVGRPQAAAGVEGVAAGPDAPRGHLRGRLRWPRRRPPGRRTPRTASR